eukprot:3414014-Amphidinium_carterae.1
MFSGTIVGDHIRLMAVQIRAIHTPFFSIFIRLVGLHPHDLNPSRKRSQGSALQIPASTFRPHLCNR